MDTHLLHAFRFVPVVILLGVAAALLRRKGQPPLALRGLKRILDGGKQPPEEPVPLYRRLLAFACVLAAIVLALL